jgi:hypothetical protein
MNEEPDPLKTVGNARLCAWATSECSCRIQSRDPALTKKLKRLPDCTQVGYSVTKGYLRLFAMPYHLNWVELNVVNRLLAENPSIS